MTVVIENECFTSVDLLQVLPFGSVPLKTYLPDGDIDLTALSHEDAEEDLAQSVLNVLQSVDDPEYQVKDVQDIRAQVYKQNFLVICYNCLTGFYIEELSFSSTDLIRSGI